MPRRSTETGKTLRPHPGTGHRKSAAKEKFLKYFPAGIVSALLVGGNPLEHSRLVNHADSGVYGVRPIRHPLSQ